MLAIPKGRHLLTHFPVKHDGAGNELWKEQHEKRIIEKRWELLLLVLYIDQHCDLLKRMKRYSEGNDESGQIESHADKVANVFQKEIAVFEIAQQAEIEDQSQRQKRTARGRLDLVPYHIIDAYLNEQKAQEQHTPVCIEDHREAKQGPYGHDAARIGTDDVENKQACREKAGK